MRVVSPDDQAGTLTSHHYACHTQNAGYKNPDEEGYVPLEQMQLEILRVSRRVYQEANKVLYSSNTFSFMDPKPFEYFIKTRSPLQKQPIRKLRLRMDWTFDYEMEQWNDALDSALVSSLTGGA